MLIGQFDKIITVLRGFIIQANNDDTRIGGDLYTDAGYFNFFFYNRGSFCCGFFNGGFSSSSFFYNWFFNLCMYINCKKTNQGKRKQRFHFVHKK